MPIRMKYYSNEYCYHLVDFVDVYDISYDSNGYPLFLFYYNGEWLRKSAKYFKPYDELESWDD